MYAFSGRYRESVCRPLFIVYREGECMHLVVGIERACVGLCL